MINFIFFNSASIQALTYSFNFHPKLFLQTCQHCSKEKVQVYSTEVNCQKITLSSHNPSHRTLPSGEKGDGEQKIN